MWLESVRSVKEELCMTAGCVAPQSRVGRVPAGVALGIIQGSNSMDFRLAVRLQRRSHETLAFVERATTVTRGEVEAQFVGAIYGPGALGAADAVLARRIRPLTPGLSIGHHAGTAGTLGAFGTNATGQLIVLSNSHVLCASKCAVGDAILQPGPTDGGDVHTGDAIARLASSAPLYDDRANYVDAATAIVEGGVPYSFEYGCGELRGLVADPRSGLRVWKKGRTTGFTRGIIRAVEVDGVEVNYGNRTLVFDNQVEIGGLDRAFSNNGDSGSLILDAHSRAVALLFAGASAAGGEGAVTFANPIGAVLSALGLQLV